MGSREDKTIEQFCKALSAIEQQVVYVVERPDQDYPGKGGCDAIISRGDKRFALEHTTIDSFQGQRLDDARFMKVLVPLEKKIRSAFPDSLIRIVVPVYAVTPGTDWQRLAEDLRVKCTGAISQMPFGEGLRKFELEGIPFPVWISRREDRARPRCYFMRMSPENLETHLEHGMARAIREKSSQLKPYRERGLATILLLDSDDIALVNHNSLADAFSKAAAVESTEELDEVFIAEADREPLWYFPVKLYDRLYPDLPEFQWFRKRQYELTYGEA